MINFEKLNALENEVFSCMKCQEVIASRLYPMPGFYGNDIRIMVVGINPGPWRERDREVLRSFNNDFRRTYAYGIKHCLIGEFLTKVFENMGISWDNVFFTNIIKCATPGVRMPNELEVLNCKSYLIQQIEIVKPFNYLFLGNFVAREFGFSQILPFVSDISSERIIAIPHPTYLRKRGLESSIYRFLAEI